jgi:hypothetical protein
MADTAETAAEEIAEMIGAEIETFEKENGEWHASMETDDQGVSGFGFSREQAFSDLIRAAKEVGWAPPRSVSP